MVELHKLIKALTAKFVAATSMKVLQPLTIENFYDIENILILNHSGQISYTQAGKQESIKPGELLFIPSRKLITITYGHTDAVDLAFDYFLENRWKYLQMIPQPTTPTPFDSLSYITFDVRVFETINLFTIIAPPALAIKDNDRLSYIAQSILAENEAQEVGKEQALTSNTQLLAIELLRHMYNKSWIADQLAMHYNYFKDTRLTNIIHYICEHLGEDLSNKKLAAIANTSEDYMGQYFKFIMGISPQEYVELQRMEQAIKLLRTTTTPINKISKEVGFKDTAYFCKRFKLRFGISAGKLRNSEAQLAI